MDDKTIYLVVFGNYWPPEVIAIFSTYEKAKEYIEEHDDEYDDPGLEIRIAQLDQEL